MKSLVAGVVTALLAAVSLQPVPVQAAPLRVASDCTYPPFGFREANGEIKGFDVDVARAVGSHLGREVDIVCQAFDGVIPGLLAGKYDMISASLSITPERLKSIDFSIPYRSSSARFVGPISSDARPIKDDGAIDTAGLDGKTVGIQRSSTYAKYLIEKFPGVQTAEYDKVDNMLLDLQAGRIDLVFAGPIKLANDFLDKSEGKGYRFIGPEINDVSYFGPGIGLGIRKNDGDLLKQVDAALDAVIKDGTFKSINAKYWSFSVLPSASGH